MDEQLSTKKESGSLRLFRSDFLEFFSHINPLVVLILFGAIITYFLVWGVRENQAGLLWRVAVSFVVGYLIWTPTEYLLHRFVFHFSPKNPSERMKRFLFLMHGVHHAEPREKSRLVMPPVVSLPLAAVFWLLFKLLVGKLFGIPFIVPSLFAGFMMGYLLYDMTHYALHHFSLSGEYFRKLRQHHMGHHFKTHNAKFGVSSWFWDRVFHTL
jgi:sterol desaturase/sphingolipid hydroxylase (fatty acid hydroxylase superfamily)